MNIGDKAYRALYLRRGPKKIIVKYSRKFKPYNANIKYGPGKIEFSFSHLWQDVSEDIQIGLAQHLLQKAYGGKERTLNIELYEKFMEKLPRYAQNTVQEMDEELAASFSRINKRYFNDFMEMPALEWGSEATTQIGTYSYHTDTVRISRVFHGLPEEEKWLLDYVMYHELLHKKFGLKHKDGSCRHHPPEFKKLEKRFHVKDAEKRLWSFVRGRKKAVPKPIVKMMRNIFK